MKARDPARAVIDRMTFEELEAYLNTESKVDLIAHAKLSMVPVFTNRMQTGKIKPLLDEVLIVAKRLQDHELLANCYRLYGWYYSLTHEYLLAIESLELSLPHVDQLSNTSFKVAILGAFGATYIHMRLYEKALDYFLQEYQLALTIPDKIGSRPQSTAAKHIGEVLFKLRRYDEAIEYLEGSLKKIPPNLPLSMYFAVVPLGELYLEKEELDKAMNYFLKGEELAKEAESDHAINKVKFLKGVTLYRQEKVEEALPYLLTAHQFFKESDYRLDLKRAAFYLSEFYCKEDDFDRAYHFLKEHNQQEDLLKEDKGRKKAFALDAQIQMERKEKEFEIRLANTRLQTLTKIASDIAHEVQNPLQFVNNFSALNIDLIDELSDFETTSENGYREASNDLKDNSQKIREYGIRISKIVDQLLEQTRKAKAGELELGDINEHNFS